MMMTSVKELGSRATFLMEKFPLVKNKRTTFFQKDDDAFEFFILLYELKKHEDDAQTVIDYLFEQLTKKYWWLLNFFSHIYDYESYKEEEDIRKFCIGVGMFTLSTHGRKHAIILSNLLRDFNMCLYRSFPNSGIAINIPDVKPDDTDLIY